jgi:hypothetical protein
MEQRIPKKKNFKDDYIEGEGMGEAGRSRHGGRFKSKRL